MTDVLFLELTIAPNLKANLPRTLTGECCVDSNSDSTNTGVVDGMRHNVDCRKSGDRHRAIPRKFNLTFAVGVLDVREGIKSWLGCDNMWLRVVFGDLDILHCKRLVQVRLLVDISDLEGRRSTLDVESNVDGWRIAHVNNLDGPSGVAQHGNGGSLTNMYVSNLWLPEVPGDKSLKVDYVTTAVLDHRYLEAIIPGVGKSQTDR